MVTPEGEELVKQSKGEFASNLFLVKKKDRGQRPVINLKQLNAYILYCHFKMEGLQNLKYMLQKGHYMCKLDLKDAYFSIPLEKIQGNLLASVGQETCTSSFAFALVWDQLHEYSQNC